MIVAEAAAEVRVEKSVFVVTGVWVWYREFLVSASFIVVVC